MRHGNVPPTTMLIHGCLARGVAPTSKFSPCSQRYGATQSGPADLEERRPRPDQHPVKSPPMRRPVPRCTEVAIARRPRPPVEGAISRLPPWRRPNPPAAATPGECTRIKSLKLEHDPLVVMSACQTGLGKIFEGGTFGLTRAWHFAGASQIVMSLWNVDDSHRL
jgi:CHAT domain